MSQQSPAPDAESRSSTRSSPVPSTESVRQSLRALADGTSPERAAPALENAEREPVGAERESVGVERESVERESVERVVSDFERVEYVVGDAERVVGDAERVVTCARDAAAFLADGRLPDLEAAVATAARRDAGDLERRGRRAQADLRRLDAALCGSDRSDTGALRPAADDCDGIDERDHFRPARGTVLGRSDESGDR